MSNSKLYIFVCTALTLTGCAADRLNPHVMDEGNTTIEFVNHMVVYNIAKARYYHRDNKTEYFLPADYRISGGQQFVNDSYGFTASAALGGAHGIIVPNVSIPLSEAQQQQLNFIPTTDALLLQKLEQIYLTERTNKIFCDGTPPAGKTGVAAQYLTRQVWVSDDDMASLAQISFQVLGANIVPMAGGAAGATPPPKPNSIYDLRNQQKLLESGAQPAASSSINTLQSATH